MQEVVTDRTEGLAPSKVSELTDAKLQEALECLVEIQYFDEDRRKHQAIAWNALNALAPRLAELAAQDPKAAYDEVMGRD